MHHRCTIRTAALGLAAVTVIAASCGSGTTTPKDGVGNPRASITLTLATEESSTSQTGATVTAFKQAVEQQTHGRVTVHLEFEVSNHAAAWDQAVIERAKKGEFDLVAARAGAWHSEGVTSLDALQLPGVIDTDEQADRLVGDAATVGRLLDGVKASGLTGLALYPEAPRYLASLTGSSDFGAGALRGQLIRTPMSQTVFDVLHAAQLSPVDLPAADFITQVSEGTMKLTDVSLNRVPLTATDHGEPIVVTRNLVLYSKFLVIGARPDSLGKLGADAAIVRAAATSSIGTAAAARTNERAALAAACAQGVTFVDVPAGDRAAFFSAVQSVIDAVKAAPGGDLLDQVRSSAGSANPSTLACPTAPSTTTTATAPSTTGTATVSSSAPSTSTGATPTSAAGSTVVGPATIDGVVLPDRRSAVTPTKGDFPNGVYRFTLTLALLNQVEPNKVHKPDDEMVGEYVMKDGILSIRYFNLDGSPQSPAQSTGGTYEVRGDHIIFAQPPEWSVPGTSGINLLRWSIKGDTVTVQQLDDHQKDPSFVVPWTRVGDAP